MMKYIYSRVRFGVLAIAIASCSNSGGSQAEKEEKAEIKLSRQELVDSIAIFEKQMLAKDHLDTALANKMIAYYDEFTQMYPGDSLTPRMLVHNAKVLQAYPGKQSKAIAVYQKMITDYPNSILAPESLVAKALMEENVGAKLEAKKSYQLFLDRYPNHDLSASVKDLLVLLEGDEQVTLEQVKNWKKQN